MIGSGRGVPVAVLVTAMVGIAGSPSTSSGHSVALATRAQSLPWDGIPTRVLVQPNRTNHPHDVAASEGLVKLLDLGDVEVVGEVSALGARHRRWDRADGAGDSVKGRPDRLPGDLRIVVRETAEVSSREIYGVALQECRLEMVASVRTIRDGCEWTRLAASGSAVESSEWEAHAHARGQALAEIGKVLSYAMSRASHELRSGRLGVLVESIDGELDTIVGNVLGADASLRLADDGLEGIDAITISLDRWRILAETGLVVHEMRPGWILVSVEPRSSRSWIIWIVVVMASVSVLMIARRQRFSAQ